MQDTVTVPNTRNGLSGGSLAAYQAFVEAGNTANQQFVGKTRLFWGMRVRNLAASPHKEFYALAELGSVQLEGASSPPPGGNLDEPELHKNQALSRTERPPRRQ